VIYQIICVFYVYRRCRESTLLVHLVCTTVLVLDIMYDIMFVLGDVNFATITTFGLLKFAIMQTIFLYKGFSLSGTLKEE
jgi:hypothetical protein